MDFINELVKDIANVLYILLKYSGYLFLLVVGLSGLREIITDIRKPLEYKKEPKLKITKIQKALVEALREEYDIGQKEKKGRNL